MMKYLTAVASLAILFVWVMEVPGANLLDNPGFEGEPELVSWTKVGTDSKIGRSSSVVYEEHYSCRFQDPTSSYGDCGVRSDPIPVTPGGMYGFPVSFM